MQYVNFVWLLIQINYKNKNLRQLGHTKLLDDTKELLILLVW